jgi:hypothetical protein
MTRAVNGFETDVTWNHEEGLRLRGSAMTGSHTAFSLRRDDSGLMQRLNRAAGSLGLAAVLGLMSVSGHAGAAVCPGDCDGDGAVMVDEVVIAVNVALGTSDVDSCGAADVNGDGEVTVDEVLAGVVAVLEGCQQPQQRAFVIATDFETGSFATISLDAPRSVVPANPRWRVHSDAVVRQYNGWLYVLNRFLGDNIQVLDPAANFATRLQCLTGERTNPQDIAFVAPDKAYVTLYDQRDLLIVNPAAGACREFIRGRIDLGSLADDDGIPEMSQMAVIGERLYVSLQRLGRRDFFRPVLPGALAIIDTNTDRLIDSIELSGTNPFAQSKGLTVAGGRIVVAQAGELGVLDGGIENVDAARGVPEGFFITEAELGGDMSDFVLVGPQHGYAVISDISTFANRLVAFDAATHEVTVTLAMEGGFISDIELNDRGELFVADRTARRPGVRVLRANDGAHLAGPIDVGLPPFDIVFLE